MLPEKEDWRGWSGLAALLNGAGGAGGRGTNPWFVIVFIYEDEKGKENS